MDLEIRYKVHQNYLKMSSYHRIQTEAWLRTIDVNCERLLDVGGSQLPIKGRTKSWSVKDYRILDLKQPHECKQKPDIVWDINKEANYAIYSPKEEFDIIFCIEVSEYWWNPVKALENINKMLKQNGILWITFPFVYGYHKPEGTDFLRYTPTGAEKLLQETGFKILEHKFRITNNSKLEEFYIEERMKFLPIYNKVIGIMLKAQKYEFK